MYQGRYKHWVEFYIHIFKNIIQSSFCTVLGDQSDTEIIHQNVKVAMIICLSYLCRSALISTQAPMKLLTLSCLRSRISFISFITSLLMSFFLSNWSSLILTMLLLYLAVWQKGPNTLESPGEQNMSDDQDIDMYNVYLLEIPSSQVLFTNIKILSAASYLQLNKEGYAFLQGNADCKEQEECPSNVDTHKKRLKMDINIIIVQSVFFLHHMII